MKFVGASSEMQTVKCLFLYFYFFDKKRRVYCVELEFEVSA